MMKPEELHAYLHAMHRSIEESATASARSVVSGNISLTYPPNHGFTDEEVTALASVPKSLAFESAIRKIIADAAAHPLFNLMSLFDGVVDLPEDLDVSTRDQSLEKLQLHDAFYESYWAWRRRRPDPGWRLDTFPEE